MTDAVLIRTDLNGDTLWTKTYHKLWQTVATDLMQTDDGGYLISANCFRQGEDENQGDKKTEIITDIHYPLSLGVL